MRTCLQTIILFMLMSSTFRSAAQSPATWSDINYAGDGRTYHNMDIYLPEMDRSAFPVVILIYGSAWRSNNGKGADMHNLGRALLDAGFAVITPNHRSSSDAVFPAQLHDIRAVVRFVRANAENYRIDTSFIGITGSSSGGHLASLTGTSGHLDKYSVGDITMDLEGSIGGYPEFSSQVDAVCSWFGPTDFLIMDSCGSTMVHDAPYSPESVLVGGPVQENPERCALANPVTYVTSSSPPFLLIHGDADPLVPHCQSRVLHEVLQQAGADCEYILIPGGEHGPGVHTPENIGHMVNFFRESSGSTE